MAGVAVVTDSTAYLPPDRAEGLTIVPLTVVLGGTEGLEGIDFTPQEVAAALVARRVGVTTSRPAPARFEEVYRRLLDGGAVGVLSVHLSAKLSGTYDAALMGASPFAGKVEVIDSRSAGMGLGFAALSAVAAAGGGADLSGVREAALASIEGTSVLFYVDSLEYLRRGGRIGAASALLGTALSVKPILRVADGAIVVRDKVRTASRALARMVDLAAESAGGDSVDLAIHHLAAPERAASIEAALTARLGDAVQSICTSEVGAVVAAHVGPGLVSIVVRRRSVTF
jgi:DegV family protein with EDD domain